MNMLNMELLVESRINDLLREAEDARLGRSFARFRKPYGLKRWIWQMGRTVAGFGKSLQSRTAMVAPVMGATPKPETCCEC